MARPKKDNGAAKIGDNSNLNKDEKFQLLGFVKEIEFHESEKAEIAEKVKESYASAKERGFNTKAILHLVRMRKMESSKRRAFEAAVDAYNVALGVLADSPLGLAAVARDLPTVDTSARPFGLPEDEPRVAD